MKQPSSLVKASNALKTTATLPLALTKYLAAEPLITGPILYILTRGPPHIRERLLALLNTKYAPLLQKNGPERLTKIVQVLKVFFVLGVWKRFDKALTSIALNGWKIPYVQKGPEWRWDGKTEVVVITGGCSGFGLEMVKGFAGKARVVVLDISDLPKELEDLPEVHYYRCDLRDFEAITSTSAQIKNRLGNPTVLINNAGIGTGKTILDAPTSAIEAIMKVNLSSHFVLIKEFLPGMLEAKKGHVIGISSMAAFLSLPGLVDYCVTKVGVLALHEGLRIELLSRYPNGHYIATTSVHPSWHATPILRGFESKLAEHGIVADPPINVANAVIEQVLSHRSGKIFMPRSEEANSGVRQMPLWVQDWSLGIVSLNPFRRKQEVFGFDMD